MSPHSQETQKKLRQDTNIGINRKDREGKRERIQIEATRDKIQTERKIWKRYEHLIVRFKQNLVTVKLFLVFRNLKKISSVKIVRESKKKKNATFELTF